MATVKILSIDGGGIRGIVPALLLQRLEGDLGTPCSDVFDYIIGTSTGGILALALAKPEGNTKRPQFSATDLVNFYEDDGPRIFGEKTGIVLPWSRPRYNVSPLQQVLLERFGDSALKDLLGNVAVTAYDMTARAPKIFRSWVAREIPGENFLNRDVARSTSAAPTYFSPAYIQDIQKQTHYHLVDGGVFANNPCARGLVEAIEHQRLSKNQSQTSDDSTSIWAKAIRDTQFVVVALGTGSLKRRYDHRETRQWGLMRWARPLLDIVFDGISDNVDEQMNAILCPELGLGRIFRFQGELTDASDDMDNTSPDNIRFLKNVAATVYKENAGAYAEMLGLLKDRNAN